MWRRSAALESDLLFILELNSAVCNSASQTVQHRLAELKTDVCVGRTFVDNCIRLHAEKRLDAPTASMAKFWWERAFESLAHAALTNACYSSVLHSFLRASDTQNKVATQCLQLHGGWGYMLEYPIAKWVSPHVWKERPRCLFELPLSVLPGRLWTPACSPSTEAPTRSWKSSSPAASSARSERCGSWDGDASPGRKCRRWKMKTWSWSQGNTLSPDVRHLEQVHSPFSVCKSCKQLEDIYTSA